MSLRNLAGSLTLFFLFSSAHSQWVQSAGPEGGNVHSFVATGSGVYAAVDRNIWYSTGSSWTLLNTGITAPVNSLALNGTTVFAATESDGVYRSTDNGLTWDSLNAGFGGFKDVRSLASGGSAMYAGLDPGGMYRSTNNGLSWDSINAGLPYGGIEAVAYSGGTVFAGSFGNGVYASTNAGLSWDSANDGLSYRYIYTLFATGGYLFAGTAGGGIFRSGDNGAHWSAVNTGLGSYVVLSFTAMGRALFAGTGDCVYRSMDTGVTWTAMNGGGWQYSTVMALSVGGNLLIAGVAGAGVVVSSDTALHWWPASPGMKNADVKNIIQQGTETVAATAGGLYETTDDGGQWNLVNTPWGGREFTGLAGSGSDVYAGTLGGGVLYSSDMGATWAYRNSGINGPGAAYIPAIAVLDSNVYAGTNGGFFRSSNKGGTWFSSTSTLPSGGINCIAGKPGYVFAGTQNGIYRSTDYGTTFEVVNNGIANGGYDQVRAILVNGGTLLVTDNVSIYRSTNNGDSWTLSSSGLSGDGEINCFWTDGSAIYAGADGVYLSTDDGLSWTAVGNGLPSSAVVSVTRGQNYFLAGTQDNSLWRRPTSEFSTPNAPVAIAATAVTATGFTVNWSAVTGASGYRVDVANDTGFVTAVQGDSNLSVGNVTSAAVGSLQPGTRYYYRVRAVNIGGTSPNSNIVSLITIPGSPVALGATSVDSTGFTANWNSTKGASSYHLDAATDTAFANPVAGYADLDVGSATSRQVTGLAAGTRYYYRVRALNASGAGAGSNIISVITQVVYPSTYSLTWNVPFTPRASLEDCTPSDYQLVGLPGNSGVAMSHFLSGKQDGQWEVYWDNGTQVSYPDYYVKYDGGAHFQCSTGKAFWLLQLSDWSASTQTVSTAPLDSNNDIVIPLGSGKGYYLITNPFNTAMPWSAVEIHNGLSGSPIREWTATGWVNAADFAPYVGYLYFKDSGISELRIPFPSGNTAIMGRPPSGVPDWKIDVRAVSGRYTDQTTSLGVISGGTITPGRHEARKPRYIAGIPYVWFDRPQWDSVYSEFAADFRTAGSDLEVWDMQLRSDPRKPVELTFPGVETVPPQDAVVLLDKSTARGTDLRKEERYTFTPVRHITQLSILIGRPDLVGARIRETLPKSFAILPNYPNPFNPLTMIPVAVPKEGRITLEIYNLLGQHVRTIYEGFLNPGLYTFGWDGRNDRMKETSTGVYICVLRAADDIRLSRKMLLMR
ncbi:MAG TPA: fibronectin type III domain-containing protein [Bacteroidota bacterium]|nr:fibronectin type III domain-containing protein [Bacteroidota bacterium]